MDVGGMTVKIFFSALIFSWYLIRINEQSYLGAQRAQTFFWAALKIRIINAMVLAIN